MEEDAGNRALASDMIEYFRLVKQAEDFKNSRPELRTILNDIFNDNKAWRLHFLEWDVDKSV